MGTRRRLEVCEFAAPLSTASEVARYGENKSINISARPSTNPRERPGHVSAIHLNISFLLFLTLTRHDACTAVRAGT